MMQFMHSLREYTKKKYVNNCNITTKKTESIAEMIAPQSLINSTNKPLYNGEIL